MVRKKATATDHILYPWQIRVERERESSIALPVDIYAYSIKNMYTLTRKKILLISYANWYNNMQVPQGVWSIYKSRSECCESSFPHLPPGINKCNPNPRTYSPTKHPTINRPEGDDYEIVPIQFNLRGLPKDVALDEIHEEMIIVLKRILLRLSDKIEGLKVSDVVQAQYSKNRRRDSSIRQLLRSAIEDQQDKKVSFQKTRLLRQNQRYEHDDIIKNPNISSSSSSRKLKNVSLLYDVYVIRVDGRRFGPIIINYMRQNYEEVMHQIQ